MSFFNSNNKKKQENNKKMSLSEIITKVQRMSTYNSEAQRLAKLFNLNIVNVSWDDNARYKNSSWGPCISDMTLQVNSSRMPVIRAPNFTDETWDVKIEKIPLVVGNENKDKTTKLKTVTLDEYLKNFDCYCTNPPKNKRINLLRANKKDSHVIMSSQACFLPIPKGDQTKFNVALYNYQSRKDNPAVLVLVSTSKGTSAQIIEGNEQKLLFNNYGMKADFLGQRLTDNRKERGVKLQGEMTKEEKQDNVILIVQIPLKQKQIKHHWGYTFKKNQKKKEEIFDLLTFDDDEDLEDELEMLEDKSCDLLSMPMQQNQSKSSFNSRNLKQKKRKKKEKANVEAAIVKISSKTTPVCKCGYELTKMKAYFAYQDSGVSCDGCTKSCGKNDFIWHCSKEKIYKHRQGYDLCFDCGQKQLEFKELNNLTTIERDDRYPIRVTLQYYKSTDNGVVNNDIMAAVAGLLAGSKKQSDFVGSLVTEPNDKNNKRPTEWVKKQPEKPKPKPKPKNNKLTDSYYQVDKILDRLDIKDEYFDTFKLNEITDEVLLLFDSMDSLKEIVPKLGVRMKVWKEIQTYKKLMKEKENEKVDFVENLAF